MEVGELHNKLYVALMGYISHQARSEGEVSRKIKQLLSKWQLDDSVEVAEVVASVIKLLRDEHFIDDMVYAKEFVRSQSAAQKRSPLFIKSFLLRKKISREIIESAILELGIDYDVESAVRFARKKAPTLEKLSDFKKKYKLSQYLRGKGYRTEVISVAVDTILGVK